MRSYNVIRPLHSEPCPSEPIVVCVSCLLRGGIVALCACVVSMEMCLLVYSNG